jgi:hypothetical protein
VAVSAEVEWITAELELILAQASDVAPEASTIDLAALGGRYNRHSERKIHVSFTGPSAIVLTESAA